MAEALIIGGIPVRVQKDTWREPARVVQGGRVRCRAGNLVSMENPATAKRIVDCQAQFLTEAEEAAFRAAVPKGTTVSIVGFGFFWDALVDIGDGDRKMADNAGTIWYIVSLHIEEV